MKKLFAMLLVLLMVFAAFGCSPAANNGGGDATPPPSGGNEEPPPEETVYDSGVRRITIFNNNVGEMATSEQPWSEGHETIYNAYSLSEYIEKNVLIQPADDTLVMMVAGTDFYGQNVELDVFKQMYLALEGSDRVPITCGAANNRSANPLNIQMFLLGDEVILCTNVGKDKITDWTDYLKQNDTPFADAETYDVVKVDGSTETVAKGDLGGLDITTVKSVVPTGFQA